MSVPFDLSRSDVRKAIEAERADWDALVEDVGPERAEQPGFMGDWTFKDVAAHITGWRERSIQRLEAASRALPEPPPPWPVDLITDDAINDWIYAQSRNRTLNDVLRDAHDSFTRLLDAAEAISLDDLVDPKRFAWTEGESLGQAIIDRSYFSHLHDEHESDIRARLAAG